MPKHKKLPSQIFVYLEEDGESEYFLAHETVAEVDEATQNDGRPVGVYKLERTIHLKRKVEIK